MAFNNKFIKGGAPAAPKGDLPKDTIIGFRSVIVGENSKGGMRVQLYAGGHPEHGNSNLQLLIEELTKLKDDPMGAKIDLHVNERTTKDGSRQFMAAFCFVKAVQDSPLSKGKNAKPDPKAAEDVKASFGKA